ncbi:MAG: hypothetical protein AABX48_02580 [Nanoarchaeota archaeon]
MIDISNDLLIQTLLFLLLFITISQILKKSLLKDKPTISIIISLVISLISIYYLSYSQLNFLAETYSLTGTIIFISIPFIIAFFFIYSTEVSSIIRKVFWIGYGMISFIIFSNNTNIPDSLKTTIDTVIVIITLAIVLFDNSIKNLINIRKNLRR